MRTTLPIACLLVTLAACSSGLDQPDDGGTGGAGGSSPTGAAGHPGWPDPYGRDVDVLFMVDNSAEVVKAQAKLVDAFPAFIAALDQSTGGRPNLHVAIVSSDMGAGSTTNGCSGNGQAGLFQTAPKRIVNGALCDTMLTGGARFIEYVNGNTNANYTGDIADVFSCIAPLGEDGCGFEQSLLSLTHALGADNFDASGVPRPPAENAGFLRSNAILAIVMVTNEDDCSAPGGAASELFSDTAAASLASPFGPGTGYRCNEFGHLCGSPPAPPPRLPPDGDYGATVALQDCVPAEDQGRLIPVSAFEAALKALKPDPANQILVAAITGVYPTTYTVGWSSVAARISNDPGWPAVKHSCVGSDASFADPAVRISALTHRFGARGLLESICDGDFRPAMQRIGAAIGGLLQPAP
jgi:hypothetical protein